MKPHPENLFLKEYLTDALNNTLFTYLKTDNF